MFFNHKIVLLASLFSLVLLVFPTCFVGATVTVTTATGGSAVSADTTGGTYTSLTGPIVTEGATGDIGTGTIILNAPAGFVFATTVNSVTATRANAGGNCSGSRSLQINGASSQTVTPTSSTITINITRKTSSTCLARITWSGVKIRPAAGTPLASGNITKTGTSVITGIINSVTNLGTLTEVAGVKTKLAFTTQPSSTTIIGTDFTTKPTITVQDQFGNTVISDNSSTITRTPVLSTQACGGTAGTGTLTSTPISGAAVTAGLMNYTAMQYSYPESIKICATSTGLTSALSNTITVNNPAPTTTSISPSSAYVGNSDFTITVNGTGFVSSSTVNWNSTPHTTIYVSPTQLTAIITAADISYIQTTPVTVVNTSPYQVSNAQYFTVTYPPAPTTTSISPSSAYAGDPNFTLTVNGTNFNSGSVVAWNGTPHTTTYVSSTQLTATITASDISYAQTTPVTVVNNNPYQASNAQYFTVSVANNPVPTTTSITPTSKTVGDSGFTLTVNGTNFISGSTVYFNGTARTTTYVSATQLTAAILTADLTSTGTFNITVVTSTPGGGTSNAQIFTVTNPPATKFVIINPTDGTVDASIAVTVQVQRADNSIDTNYQNDVTLATSGLATGAGLVSIVNGVGTINISDTLTQTVVLSLIDSQSTGLNVDSTQDVVFAPGTVAIYTLSDAINFVAGERVGYTVTRTDQYGNLVTSGTSLVYLYSSSSSSSKKFYNAATAGSVITFATIASGESSATFWYYDDTPGTYTITASDNSSSPDGDTGINDGTDSISVLASPLASFEVVGDVSGTAGNRASFTVTRKNVLGAPMTTGATVVYLYSSSSSLTKQFYNSAVDGAIITSITIPDGSSSASFWYYDEVPGTYTITGSDNSTTPDGNTGVVDGTASITITAGTVAQFILNNPGDFYAKSRLGYSVTRKDAFGNLVTTGTSTVYLYSSSSSSSKKFYSDSLGGTVITSITIASGQAAASFWYYDEEPGTYTITASDNSSSPDGSSGISDGTDSVIVMPVAVKFVILSASGITVDNTAVITVQAQKPDDSVDTTYQSDVTLNTTGSATGAGIIDIVNGVGTINISDTMAETVALSLTDSQVTGLNVDSTQDIVFNGGALAQFVLDDPGPVTVGERIGYTVTRKDQYNNLTISGSSTVYLFSTSTSASRRFYNASTGGEAINFLAIPDGASSATFWYYDETPGTYAVTASDNAAEPDGNANVNDAVDSIIVNAGPASKFILTDPGDVDVSTRIGYTVTRKDQYNNLTTFGSSTVYLYSSSATAEFYNSGTEGVSVTSADITDGNSTTQFWYYDDTPGTYTITASDNLSSPDGDTGISDSTDTITISAIPIVATRFVIIDPTDGTIEAPISVTVQAQDDLGNLDTTYQSDVTLNTTGSATGAGIIDIVNGIGTINISDTMAETVALSLIDSQVTGLNVDSTQDVVFNVGGIRQFAITNPGDMSAGSRIGYTVTRKDSYGNLVTSGLTPVYLYALPANINKKFYDSASGGSVITFVNIVDGQSSADFWYYDENAETSSVVVSDNSSSPDGDTGISDISDEILVSAGPVAKFILDNPGDMTANTRLGYTVKRQDEFGNFVTAGVTLVYLYSSSTGVNHFYDAATGGLVVNSIAIDDGNQSAGFWYYDEEPGTWVVTTSDNSSSPDGVSGVDDAADSVTVALTPIVATRFVILNPGDSRISNPVTVTVKAEDGDGNVDVTFQNDVTLNATGSATGAGLVDIINGVGTIQINDAIVETITLSLSDTQTTGLNVSSTAQINFLETAPVYVPGVSGVSAVVIPKVSEVSFSGRAYPSANLSILAVKETEEVIQKETVTSADGSFEITFTGLPSGSRSYALLVQDKDGRTAQSKIYDLNLLNSDSQLKVTDIVVSPTIGFPRPTVTRGDFLTIVGYAAPASSLTIEVDGQAIGEKVVAEADGAYRYLYNTALLGLGSHTVKASQTTFDGVESEFSPQKVFFTTDLTVPKTDFNSDGQINISDWSIFLARWFSTDSATRLLDDLNADGKVDATDFSIFIRTLRR